MSRRRVSPPVRLFVGLLSSDPDLLRRGRQLLGKQFGSVDHTSPIWPFTQTDYYTAEMGADLKRMLISFSDLVPAEQLVEIKLATDVLERQVAEQVLADVPRPINLDPGYLQLDKVVLASTKDASHRLALGRGIYGEVTLRFNTGAWEILPWTYPDYREPAVIAFFDELRRDYRVQRREYLSDIGGEPTPP